jgi:hypothetical protein
MSEIMTDDEKRFALKKRLREHPEEIVEVYREWRDQNLGLNEVLPDSANGEPLSEGRRASRLRQNEKRSVLGWISLNSWFEGSVRHHIDQERFIYIPKVLHRSNYHNLWTGQGMERINSLARFYL